MKDVYLLNNDTGEIQPAEQVFREFYENHGIKESVFDFWTDTGIEVDESDETTPDDVKAAFVGGVLSYYKCMEV